MTRTNRFLLALLVVAAASSAFWFLALAPKRDQVVRLDGEITAKRAELQTLEGEIGQYEQARAAYPRNYAMVARLGKAVPADDDVRSLMVQLDAAAKRAGVEFEIIDVGKGGQGSTAPVAPSPGVVVPGASANPAGFSTMPMSFAFEGSYFELSDFLARLERFVSVSNARIDVTGRLLILQSLSMQPSEAGFPHMRAQLGATSYLVPEAEGLTAGATPAGPTAQAAAGAAGTSPNPTVAPASAATVTGVVR